jgi:succinate dehydrogenase / fumarate reductase flavoprotein subunit
LERKESRGGHFREDYTHRDDINYMRHTMAYREPLQPGERAAGGPDYRVRLDYKPVVQTRYEPMERHY